MHATHAGKGTGRCCSMLRKGRHKMHRMVNGKVEGCGGGNGGMAWLHAKMANNRTICFGAPTSTQQLRVPPV